MSTADGPLPGTPLDSGLPTPVCCRFALSPQNLASVDTSVSLGETPWEHVNLTIEAYLECQRFGPQRTGRIRLGIPRRHPALPIPTQGIIRKDSRATRGPRSAQIADSQLRLAAG